VSIRLVVNGREHSVSAEAETPLLYVLRNDLQLKGTRYGCGQAQCGACMVLLDGKAVPSCDLPVSAAAGKAITTIEGLACDGELHPLQRAFVAEQAAQCGFCLSGILVAAKALLDANPDPTEEEIRTALKGNLCRCGTHQRMLRAVRRAAKEMRAKEDRR
jgi:nicotinate dehydrogenase subunit A